MYSLYDWEYLRLFKIITDQIEHRTKYAQFLEW